MSAPLDRRAPAPRGLEELYDLARSRERRGGAVIVAFVGAGGKTSSLFALARYCADSGKRVLVTTTTRIRDPEGCTRLEGKGFGPLLLLADPAAPEARSRLASAGSRALLAASRTRDGTKLVGIDPASLRALGPIFDFILVEADGARGLSIKAPSDGEPAIPPDCDLVAGLVGLDAIGKPLGDAIAHRPELLGPLVNCEPGEPLEPRHVARLVSSPLGLFKGAPPASLKVLLLNKSDALPAGLGEAYASAISAELERGPAGPPAAAAAEAGAGAGLSSAREAPRAAHRGRAAAPLMRPTILVGALGAIGLGGGRDD